MNRLLWLAITLTATSVGCGQATSTQDERCSSGRCDDLDLPDSQIEDSPCDGVLVDLSGRNHRKVAGRLNDPLAKFALRTGDSCPTTFQDIMAKLRTTDTENCDVADPRSGIATRLVSETAQITGEATNYRMVTSRKCGERDTHGLLFSLFGVDANAQSLPEGVEIIAFDETAGVFNYYEAERGGTLNFFGNSKDMLIGAEGPVRRCATCHTGGGLIMKELETPWLHWEGHMDTPGARELVDRFDDLGRKEDGREFENVVKVGNGNWNQTRAKHMIATATTKEVLRPLFCTVEVNLDNGADFESPPDGSTEGSPLRKVPGDSLMHPLLVPGISTFPPVPSGISINPEDYEKLIKANNQRVPGIPGAVDTVFDYAFVERSQIDKSYVTQLLVSGVLNTALIEDILMVDYTRPIFSDDRCGLLDFVPSIPSAELTTENLRKGLIQNLLGAEAGTPAAELLANLTNLEQDHKASAQTFLDACEARGNEKHVLNEGTAEETTISANLVDMVALTSLHRRLALELPVFEFPQTMPTDDLNTPKGSRLHPVDCTMITEFVAIAEPGVLPDPDPDPTPAQCAHEICETGATLDANCSPCAAQICEADAFCCGTEWDSICVGQVATVCNQVCQ